MSNSWNSVVWDGKTLFCMYVIIWHVFVLLQWIGRKRFLLSSSFVNLKLQLQFVNLWKNTFLHKEVTFQSKNFKARTTLEMSTPLHWTRSTIMHIQDVAQRQHTVLMLRISSKLSSCWRLQQSLQCIAAICRLCEEKQTMEEKNQYLHEQCQTRSKRDSEEVAALTAELENCKHTLIEMSFYNEGLSQQVKKLTLKVGYLWFVNLKKHLTRIEELAYRLFLVLMYGKENWSEMPGASNLS